MLKDALWSILLPAALLAGAGAHAQDYRQWTDKEGVVHITDDPDEQRGEVKARIPSRKAEARERSAAAARPGDSSMKRFELPYLSHEGTAQRVIVQATLNGRLSAPMAIDTGAPGLVLSFELAERLGVFSSDQGKLIVMARGIGGGVPAIRTILESVAIGGASAHFVPVTITDQMSDAFEGLIGMDFMSRYSMTIDPSRNTVVLLEHPPAEQAPGGHGESWWRNNFAEFRGLREAWRQYHDRIEQEIRESQISAGAGFDMLAARRSLAEFQHREADKLLSRLERYASLNSVPRHWR